MIFATEQQWTRNIKGVKWSTNFAQFEKGWVYSCTNIKRKYFYSKIIVRPDRWRVGKRIKISLFFPFWPSKPGLIIGLIFQTELAQIQYTSMPLILTLTLSKVCHDKALFCQDKGSSWQQFSKSYQDKEYNIFEMHYAYRKQEWKIHSDFLLGITSTEGDSGRLLCALSSSWEISNFSSSSLSIISFSSKGRLSLTV